MIKKHYMSHYQGEVVRWYYREDGDLRLSNETGTLKGWDDATLEYVIKTKDGEMRASLVCNEADRLKYFKDISNAYENGFRDGLKHARDNG